jgi:hypothetical protein
MAGNNPIRRSPTTPSRWRSSFFRVASRAPRSSLTAPSKKHCISRPSSTLAERDSRFLAATRTHSPDVSGDKTVSRPRRRMSSWRSQVSPRNNSTRDLSEGPLSAANSRSRMAGHPGLEALDRARSFTRRWIEHNPTAIEMHSSTGVRDHVAPPRDEDAPCSLFGHAARNTTRRRRWPRRHP